ncbi:MAG: YtxH domain-containing protein [bacterium]
MSEEKTTVERPPEKRRGSFLSLALGFLTGAVVGAVTALLYAPQSGAETRGRIKEKVSDLSSRAGDALNRARDAMEEAKDQVTGAFGSTRERTSQIIESARERIARKTKDEQ